MNRSSPSHRAGGTRRPALGLLALGIVLSLPWWPLLAQSVARDGDDPAHPPNKPRLVRVRPAEAPPGEEESLTARSLAQIGIPVTGGAAPGYVPDAVCGNCHGDLFRSYREVGMARSFYPPSAHDNRETLGETYFHEISGRHYRMTRAADGQGLVFERWVEGSGGERFHEIEIPVDWVLGSGHTSKVYLYRTPSGEMFQLPIAWYSREGRFRMAPGFDRPDHEGVLRRVRRECMFCHNAYPDVPADSDDHAMPQTFPAELPHGTGCQRCHGPGARHVDAASGGMADPATVRAAIVQPGKLEPTLRDDVCHQCHLQPSVSLFGPRRLGRGDYSYRPGTPLTDYVIKMDVVQEGIPRDERFEINHHPYRLRQSLCFERGPDLSCLTCHDPHRKVPEPERAAHYRAACLTCHDAAPHDGLAEAARAEILRADTPADDCVACHMPRRRTQDVVHVVMTDHLIQRRPLPAADRLAPRAERDDPVLLDVEPYDSRAPGGDLGELHRVLTVNRAGGNATTVKALERLVGRLRPPEVDPYLDLGRTYVRTHRWPEALETFQLVLGRAPRHEQARAWLGLAQIGLGRERQALELLRAQTRASPERAEIRYNLARLLLRLDRPDEAGDELEAAVAARPNMTAAWNALGNLRARQERWEEAEDALRRALALDPSREPAYVDLSRLLVERGRVSEAEALLRQGWRTARDPRPLNEALADLPADDSAP